MKKVLLFLATVTFVFSVNAQKETPKSFGKKTSFLHIGVGFGGGFYAGDIKTPPVSLSFESGVTEKISVGGIIAYASSSYSLFSADDIKYSHFLLGGRGNYHFGTSEKFDPFVGLTLGYNIVSAKYSGNIGSFKAEESALIFGGQIGANYYFSPKFGAFAELGYGIGILTVGITAKL